MIYFDAVVNLMHDIWKKLAPSPIRALFTTAVGQMKFMGTTQGMPQKGIILFGKKLIFKCSFSRTGATLWNQISPN